MLRVAEVAERLNCSIKTVYTLIESGRLGHHRCPGIRISDEQLLAYLDETRREQAPDLRRKNGAPRPRLKHISL